MTRRPAPKSAAPPKSAPPPAAAPEPTEPPSPRDEPDWLVWAKSMRAAVGAAQAIPIGLLQDLLRPEVAWMQAPVQAAITALQDDIPGADQEIERAIGLARARRLPDVEQALALARDSIPTGYRFDVGGFRGGSGRWPAEVHPLTHLVSPPSFPCKIQFVREQGKEQVRITGPVFIDPHHSRASAHPKPMPLEEYTRRYNLLLKQEQQQREGRPSQATGRGLASIAADLLQTVAPLRERFRTLQSPQLASPATAAAVDLLDSMDFEKRIERVYEIAKEVQQKYAQATGGEPVKDTAPEAGAGTPRPRRGRPLRVPR